jgi:hypothetical protein
MVAAALSSPTRRLQAVLIAFFVLVTVGLLLISRVQPDLYGRDLAALPAGAGALLFIALIAAEAILIAGILRRWPWLFWALLVVFGVSAIRVPLLPLQLARLIPGGTPPWYAILQAGIGLGQAAIAVWMLRLYRRHGVWACQGSSTALPGARRPGLGRHGR